MIEFASEVIYLEDGEYGWLSAEDLQIYKDNNFVSPTYKSLSQDKVYAQKEGYRFFMEKEIYEQAK